MIDHKLKLFCLIVKTVSFSKAAEITGLTQPGVSRKIQALEDVYQTRLLNRQGGTVTLTEAGEKLYKYAEEINSHYTTMSNKLRSLSSAIDNTISIGSSHTIGNFIFPEIALNFNKQFPDIIFDLNMNGTDEVLRDLNDRNIDIALVNGIFKKDNLITRNLFCDELVLIMNSSHKLSAKKKISILDIMNEPFIANNKNTSIQHAIEQYLSKKGLSMNHLNIVLKTGTTESAKRAVEHGLGISIVPRCSIIKEENNGTISSAAFKEGKLTGDYSLMYRKNRDYSSISSKFIRFISNYPFQLSS